MTRPSRRAIVRTVVWKTPETGSTTEPEHHLAVAAASADGGSQLQVTATALARMVRRES